MNSNRYGRENYEWAKLILEIQEQMPGAKGQYAFNRDISIKNILATELRFEWESKHKWGYRQYSRHNPSGEFLFWKKPPTSWKQALELPEKWENCITFPNGFAIEVCNHRHADLRGRNDDFVFMDLDSKFSDRQQHMIHHSVRSRHDHLRKSKYYHSVTWM